MKMSFEEFEFWLPILMELDIRLQVHTIYKNSIHDHNNCPRCYALKVMGFEEQLSTDNYLL